MVTLLNVYHSNWIKVLARTLCDVSTKRYNITSAKLVIFIKVILDIQLFYPQSKKTFNSTNYGNCKRLRFSLDPFIFLHVQCLCSSLFVNSSAPNEHCLPQAKPTTVTVSFLSLLLPCRCRKWTKTLICVIMADDYIVCTWIFSPFWISKNISRNSFIWYP